MIIDLVYSSIHCECVLLVSSLATISFCSVYGILIQFNGDMYPSCNGKFVYHMLESVETYDDLAAAILKFDGECFGYADMRFGCANMHNIDA